MVRYPPKAAAAQGYLKSFYNDVEIYVEDTTCLNMHNVFFERLLKGRAKFSSVIPLGGKNSVIQACEADQNSDGRKRLYIIDGDFDILLGCQKPPLKYLIRLNAYCIENLIVCENACVELARECLSDSDTLIIKRKLNLQGWKSRELEPLTSLFILYAIAFDFGVGVKTVNYSVFKLTTHRARGPNIDRRKIQKRARYVIRSIVKKVGWYEFVRKKHEIRNRINQNSIIPLETISGKDYVIPLLKSRLRAIANYRGGERELKVRLARNCVLDRDIGLARRVRLCGSWK